MRILCRHDGILLAVLLLLSPAAAMAQVITVDTAPAAMVNRFIPEQTLGAGLDRISTEAVAKTLNKRLLDQVAPSGWGPMTYRNNTELAVEDWHWNPVGTWSEAGGKGYFVGSSSLGEPISNSYGYTLPRRGFTRNDGTGNTGFSRLTDGDSATFWKSNPYLASAFTGESDRLHAQWIVIDLKRKEMVDTIRLEWAAPFARRYELQYWTGDDPIGQPNRGVWQMLPMGEIADGKGGVETIHFSKMLVQLQFVRVLMTESSGTCTGGDQSDQRNCVGYAIREVGLGTTSSDGVFHDLLRHTPDQDQSTTYCSSVDPWHASTSLESTRQSQPGLDLFFQSGITHHLPAMIPVSIIYSVPADAVAQIRYLEARHYPISYIEMGEEADGQYMSPEDYGALYLQFATALHNFDPALKLGGPAFQGSNDDILTWPDAEGRISWLSRFLDYLKQHQRSADLAFFSFEHYPLPGCHFEWSGLYDEPQQVTHIMDTWANDGLPASMPVFITESNLSSTPGEAYMDNFAGLWLADYIGSFLTAGGNGVYYFHYVPLSSDLGCSNSPGTFGMFHVDKDYSHLQPLAQFFASELINREWVEPGSLANEIYRANATLNDGAGHALVTAYADKRPDGQWSILLVNRDQDAAHAIRIEFRNGASGVATGYAGDVETMTFGKAEYQWHPSAVHPMSHPVQLGELVVSPDDGRADPDGPAKHRTIHATPETEFEVPAASIVVVRGKLGVLTSDSRP
jgi:hypothetical protein